MKRRDTDGATVQNRTTDRQNNRGVKTETWRDGGMERRGRETEKGKRETERR